MPGGFTARSAVTQAMVVWFRDLGMKDIERVGGKNASLGEMIRHLSQAGVRVPDGFATTADAFREFIAHEGLADRIKDTLGKLNVDDVQALHKTGKSIRDAVVKAPFPQALERDIRAAYAEI